MTKKFKKQLALFILEGIIIFTLIPVISYAYHCLKDWQQ
ncbi:hypothetical protein HOV23_gp034 [Pseudomonas phage Lana]|uniref:Uncharacterized protein n=1 Tax=Pseudomonas phage Lana TaxID=2530172 RepID=A0A481W7S3_9CAUD|nr:hypothetical protein HOV23_gp034 [Pseudomonas phage Lana]QBJ04539.1 hypothetical protein [Pseudomonas phage Lana]